MHPCVLSSSAFEVEQPIPKRYAQKGEGQKKSPPSPGAARYHLLLTSFLLLVFPGTGCKATIPAAVAPTASRPMTKEAPASAPAPTYKLEKVTEVEGISEYRLDNGLRVLLFPDPSRPTITVAITYLVGSRHEGYGETGMAHLLEHLLFKGSRRHRDIPRGLTAHGARPNGTTWVDRTNYFETFEATDENLRWALDLEADRMVSSFVAQEDLDSEMTVVRNEFEMGENRSASVLEERVTSTAYLWHNYGKSTIGARSDIEKVRIENLRAFYKKYYQPDNAVLVVAGRFDTTRTLGIIAAKFGPIPRPARVLRQDYTVEPPQDGERTVVLRRVGDSQAMGFAYHIPAGSHAEFPAVDVLAHVLGHSPTGRLYKALVEAKLAASVRATAYQFRDPGLMYVSARVRQVASLARARETTIRCLDELSTTRPVTQKELDRARTFLLKRWEMIARNSQYAAKVLSEWAAMGDWRLTFLYRDRLKKLTLDQVRAAATSYLVRTNRTVGLFFPTKKPQRVRVPPRPDVAALVKGYKGGAAMARGEVFDPSLKNIEARLTRLTLPSGMKVTLLPKKTRGATVRLKINLHFGDDKSLRNLSQVGALAGAMLMRGTKKRTKEQLEDEVNRLQAQLRVSGSATRATVTAEVTRDKLPDLLRLVAEVLQQPALSRSELAMAREKALHTIESEKSNPFRVAFTGIFRHLFPYPKNDVRYYPLPAEKAAAVKKVRLGAVRKFHADFYGASAGELALVGDFDRAAVSALVKQLFGSWKSRRRHRRLASVFKDRPVQVLARETPDKESALIAAGLRHKMRNDHPDYAALVLTDFMTGGGFLSSRLARRLRQKEGISYGVGSFSRVGRWDEDAMFMLYAIYAPQNDGRVLKAIKEELAAVAQKGFAPGEVERAKKAWLKSRKVSRSQDRKLVAKLSHLDYQGRTLAWDAALEQKVRELTAERINKAVVRHLAFDKLSISRAGDFAGAKKKGLKPDRPGKKGGAKRGR